MKKSPSSTWTWKKILAGCVVAILAIATIVLWPWWYPWILWTDKNTSWVTLGPGVDPTTYAIKDRTLSEADKIPKIIHQTWRDKEVPREWKAAQASCQKLHPEYEYKLWTDVSSRDFIAEKHPDLLKTWDSYPFAIQRADIIRYAVLQTYGGFYLDLDIECLHPLDFLAKYPIVLPKTWPVGFSNDFIACEPDNPFMTDLVQSIPAWNWNLMFKYPTVMFSTGPMFVTTKASLWKARKDLWILTDSMYNKYVKSDSALFSHLHGSSWHGDDAKSFLFIWHHPILLAVLTLSAFIGVGFFLWKRSQRNYLYQRLKVSPSKGMELPHLRTITVVKDS